MAAVHSTESLPAGWRRVFLGAGESFPAIAIDTPACRALVALQGAQLLTMQPAGAAPLLWLSPGARYVAGKAVRGGIPLCFPWFGNHPDDPALPAHGFARNREWRLQYAGIDAGVAQLQFALEDDAQTRALWPHIFSAEVTLSLGAGIDITLAVTNRGDSTAPVSFAFHNYFPVVDVAACCIEGLAGLPFHDKLQPDAPLAVESVPLRPAAEVDRVYTGAGGACRIVDMTVAGPVAQTIAVTAPDCRNLVVWNPWGAKAARLGDVPGDSWRRFVCVEPANVGADTILLAAGESRRWSMRIAHA